LCRLRGARKQAERIQGDAARQGVSRLAQRRLGAAGCDDAERAARSDVNVVTAGCDRRCLVDGQREVLRVVAADAVVAVKTR